MRLKLLIAPDSFKGSLSAIDAAICLEKGIKATCPNVDATLLPLADGGEGTVDAMIRAVGGTYVTIKVDDPLGRPIEASYGKLRDGRTAVIEMATASGLPLLSREERDPVKTTSYGTGQLIRSALDEGCRRLIIGIGGSATNDGGMGMAQALGIRFLDSNGRTLGMGGGELCRLDRLDISNLDNRLSETEILVASDVRNPLCGLQGASYVYSYQKGATPEMAAYLDGCLANLASVIKRQLGQDIAEMPGSGAAGGLGAGLKAFLNAELRSGIELIMDVLDFRAKAETVDLILTGEGRIDAQSAFGKVLSGVVSMAEQLSLPVVAVGGSVASDFSPWSDLLVAVSCVTECMDLETALENAEQAVVVAAERIGRLLAIGGMIRNTA
ncbi:MAG: glycerate kinase [bacterium]|jgi:glycerate kinase|nr:glycerate kinase [bacterium]MDD4152942.1 glycerate kinase [bacterium]MDD4557404.1 glycerate kinase [bacterium]